MSASIAAAEALEWAYEQSKTHMMTLPALIRERAAELRAQAAASGEPYACPHCGGTKGHWEGCRAPTEPTSVEPVSAETQANRDAADVFLNEFCKEHCAERIAQLEGLLHLRGHSPNCPTQVSVNFPPIRPERCTCGLTERIRAALGEG